MSKGKVVFYQKKNPQTHPNHGPSSPDGIQLLLSLLDQVDKIQGAKTASKQKITPQRSRMEYLPRAHADSRAAPDCKGGQEMRGEVVG